MHPIRFTALVAALCLTACSTIPRYEAANDIHTFLISIRDGDRSTFDQHVDRPALKGAAAIKADGAWSADRRLWGGWERFWREVWSILASTPWCGRRFFRAVALDVGYSPDRPIPGRIGHWRVRASPRRGPCLRLHPARQDLAF